VCFSESFERVCVRGFQNAVWELGKSAASGTEPIDCRRRSTTMSTPGGVSPNGTPGCCVILRSGGREDPGGGKGTRMGDVEQRHHRLKTGLLAQELMLAREQGFCQCGRTNQEFVAGLLARPLNSRTKKARSWREENRGDEGSYRNDVWSPAKRERVEGGLGESESIYRPKCVPRCQSADWRAGRSAVVHGAGGDRVRTEEGGKRLPRVAWAKETTPVGLSPLIDWLVKESRGAMRTIATTPPGPSCFFRRADSHGF